MYASRSISSTLLVTTVAVAAAAAAPALLTAQHISLKTVPIPTGEQFQILPSRNLGMGSLHVALDDPMLDPFTNPARGALAERLRVYVLPTLYGEANNTMGGRSFPVAVTVPGERVFGSVAFAMQQVDDDLPFNGWGPLMSSDGSVIVDNSSSNIYLQGAAGAKLSDATSVGIGFSWADLQAVDGVSLLYARSAAIDQSGSVAEARVGVTHDFGGERRLDATVMRSSVDMTHDVFYQEWWWDQPSGTPHTRSWTELNEDRTITWGARFRYTQPLGNAGARVGLIATGNTKAHPKIPNYNVVNIPRDPGNSTVFNFGAGLSSVVAGSAFSMELIFEPGRSHTWAFADTVIVTPSGMLQKGDRTVDNQFRYGNWQLAVGIDREGERAGFQLGMRMHQTRYSLDQHNYLTDVRRKTNESWIEWSPAWGGIVKFDEFDLRYTGRFTARGWPDIGFGTVVMEDAPTLGVDFVVGPTGPVNLAEYRVTTHRLMVSVPFGR